MYDINVLMGKVNQRDNDFSELALINYCGKPRQADGQGVLKQVDSVAISAYFLLQYRSGKFF